MIYYKETNNKWMNERINRGIILLNSFQQAVSGKDRPLNNFFFYDGLDGNGMVECFK